MEKTIKYLENGEYHYATVRSVGDLAQLKTNSKETLVEAINELWNGGGNADPSKAPKPEGYDQLVQDVADAVKNQQEISQQWIEWQNEEAQLTEERKQAYLQAMKEMQEAIDKAKADAAALDDKTAKLDEQITKTFSDLDTSIQNMHEQLQKEADRMNKDLQDTKGTLSTLRTDLQNAQMDNGKIHDELTNINGKFEHKVWQTDLDPLKEQIDRAETSVQQTKDELLGKASRQDLDTVSNTVSKLDTQLKETAKGVEISVKKDELGGEIAEALTNKTNILLGTRRFTTNNWTQRDHVEICSDPWKGFLVAKQNSPIEGIQQAYDVKAGTTYTFSLFAKMDTLDDSNKPQIILAKNNLDTSLDTKIDVWRKEIEDITSDFKRYDLTFTPSEDCTIYPHVISNSNNPIFVCGYQLEIGKTSTPWEPNQEDVGDYVEKSEAQFNVYNDKIQALTEKQRQQGDTQEKLRTEVTQTAEGTRQVSENLKKTNDDITKLRGKFEVKADHMKSEYETYTNKAVGQISDSTLNLIRNSSFQNKDEDFAQWQNVSAKANVRQDENGLRWVELTQSGMTTDNIVGLTSNYFNVKQGKVTVAVDIKSGDKASLDNDSVLSLELYNDVKKRVDFYDVSLSELGLSKELLGDHKVHRGLYRLGIDRNDAKYMTVKAKLVKNGDLYFTNFSVRLSSIDDGAYEPNPDDLNQQILKQNTKIEQNAKEVAIKANSVDVTRDIKSAVENNNGGGVNLLKGTKDFRPDSIWLPLGAWVRTNDTYNDLTIFKGKSTEDWNGLTQYYSVKAGETYTFSLNARYESGSGSSALYIMLNEDPENGHKAAKVSPWSRDITLNENWQRYSITFTVNSDGYIKPRIERGSHNKNVLEICGLKLERGTVATPWTPASEDTSEEIKSAKDAAIQVASDQINIHVNELTTSFDDKLNKRINEQKTASEKFTSDGIEQVVTKVTNVKNDVDRLGDKVNSFGGGVNLVKDTSESEISGKAYDIKDYYFSEPLEPNTKYTISIDAKVDQEALNHQQFIFVDPYTAGWSWGTQMSCISASLEYQHYRYTFITPDASQKVTNISVYLAHPDGATNGDRDNLSGTGYFKKLKVEKGEVATPWTPYSQDINKKIDTQTLDTANIDEMRTQGRYFVRNLTGNPIGGWVYVDVTGNNNDRVRQDVYQDNGSKHMYRRGFNGTWSGWEQGAYLSDVNNVKTEVTASVKNLGDRVTTEVNSITSRVNSNNGGGINLQVGTDDCSFPIGSNGNEVNIENYSGTTKMFHAKKGGFYSSYNAKSFVPTPGETYTLSADVKGNGTISGDLFRYEGGDNGNLGTIKLTNDWQRISNTVHINKVSGQWVFYIRDSNDFYVKHIKIERGSVATPWSPAPEDTTDAIKEVNTKWDVANGQIQGKVTATDVNNILNGKGYATQSWAQTMFQMKSDSITLQAVRDNITNGIQNQVNDTRNLLNNLQVGGRNYLQESDKLVTGWAQDLGTLPNEVLNSLAGKTITISVDVEWNDFKSDSNKQNRLGFELAASGSDGRSYWLGAWKSPTTASGKERISTQYSLPAGVTFTVNNNSANGYVSINGTGKVSHAKIEVGNKQTDWSPAPNDDIGTNLLKGTADFSGNWRSWSDPHAWKHDGWTDPNGNQAVGLVNKIWEGYYQPRWLEAGTYTFSCYYWISGTTTGANVFAIPNGGENPMTLLTASKGLDTTKDKWHKAIFSFTVTKAGNSALRIELSDSNATLHVASYKLEKGSTATDWSPAPEDSKSYTDQQITNTNKKIDTQVLDSANVDDLKTPGHYFIHNLTNSPITGWVYVDVAGGTDRLKQDVYQDSGYEHKSRRWFGNRWTEWTTDVNNKNVISQINITPDQIKIASNKIVIDGNTDIHGDLRTDRVRLVGKNGAIDMTGDTGIKLTNNDGSSMLLGRGNIDLTYKNDFRMNIDSSLMTIMQRNQFTDQNKPIAILNIGASWNHSYEKIRGADIRYNPGNVNDVNLHGADYLALSYNKPNLIPGEANIKPQLVMAYQDLKFDENHYLWRKGVNVADDLTIQEYQRINVGYRDKEDQSGKWTNDPLMIHRMQWGASSQADRYQPTIRLGYSKDSMGSAGVTFLWNQVKPFGNRDISDLGEIWFNGQRFVFGWASHESMFGNQNQPAFMRLDDKGGIMSGIAFTPGSTWDLGSGAWNITQAMMALKNRGII